MKKSVVELCLSLLIFACTFTAANAQNLKADYQFQGNLNSSVAGAPAMTNLGAGNTFAADTVDGYARQSLRFPFNNGVAVSTAGVIPNNAYTIVLLFRFDETSGFRRTASFDNGTTDNGAYVQDGRLEFETTSNPQFFPNTYIQVVVVREASGAVRAYRDGTLRVNVPNDGGAFQISAANILRFFQDDPFAPTEASAGNLARVRLFDAPMTTAQVQALERAPNAIGAGEQPILFSGTRDGTREIYTMNFDGSNHRRLTNNTFTEYDAKWSPDRTRIVYTRNEGIEQIWIMNADGTNQTRLTNTATFDHSPSWKPDGTKILFSRCSTSGLCDLFTMNPDGANQTPLPAPANTSGDEDHSRYSPDGTKIIFLCQTNTFANPNICTANADGSNRQQLTNTVSPISHDNPVYSPNGAKIAFERRSNSADSFTSEVYVMDSDGNNQTNLTNNNIFDAQPYWSPDGTRLLFSSQRESVFTELYTMSATNGSLVQRLIVNSVGETPSDWYRPSTIVVRKQFDFDGDGKADVSVFRPSGGAWYLLLSTNGFAAIQFGLSTDKIVPADYDGDGRTDIAVFRDGTWYLLRSQAGFAAVQFGQAGDIPQPFDFDGDGRAELAVFRGGNWYLTNLATNQFTVVQFGSAGDKPVAGDYDGDGKADYAVFRPSDGVWYMLRSQTGFAAVQFGAVSDKPVPADYDGDGKTDQAVYRDGNWYLNRSQAGFAAVQFGIASDTPAPADFDGDGKADVAVFRGGVWYQLLSASGFAAVQFGAAGDRPIPNAFVQ